MQCVNTSIHNHPDELLPLGFIFVITCPNVRIIYSNKAICICYHIVLKKKKKKHIGHMTMVNITFKWCLFVGKKPLVLTDRHFLMKGSFADVRLIEKYPF